MRKHKRKSFFKYTSAEVAQIIMRQRSLRWSSPIILNDPFDIVREMAEDITSSEIHECMLEEMIGLIDVNGQIPDGLRPELRHLLGVIRQSHDPVLKQKVIHSLRRTELIQYSEGLEALRAKWRSLVSDVHILCLSEENDIAPMWDRYADGFRGVVFEFSCIDELGSAWLSAEKVNYVDRSPMLSDAKGWAKLLMMKRSTAVELLFHESTHTKTKDWSYEKEWRILWVMRAEESGDCSYGKFHKDELQSICLGPQIEDKHREQIMGLRDKLYPHANICQGSICGGSHITFEQTL